VNGGLTLMFDNSGKLKSIFLRPVSDEDARQIMILTADLIRRGQVAPLT
jgi:hypothetical protein